MRSGRVLCDPGQVAFLLSLGKCVGEPSGILARSVILSAAPGGSSRRGHLFPGPHVAHPMPGPQGLLSLHTVGVHTVRCAVNPSREVTGWIQWRHWGGGAPGLCAPVLDARLSHTHHSAERRGGALLPGALATAGAEQDWSPVGPGPTAAKRWPPPACSVPRPQMGAENGGWVPCGACLLRAGTVSLHAQDPGVGFVFGYRRRRD